MKPGVKIFEHGVGMENTNRYMITMRWYVETDEELVSGSQKANKKIQEILQHKKDGRPACTSCPTRNHEGVGILDYHYFMGDKPVYMSVDKINQQNEDL